VFFSEHSVNGIYCLDSGTGKIVRFILILNYLNNYIPMAPMNLSVPFRKIFNYGTSAN